MPSLNDQLNSFKARMRNAPVLGKRTVTQTQEPVKPPQPAESEAKRQRPNYAQSVATTTGTHLNTQFLHAIEYLKSVEKPVSLDDLQSYLSFPVEPLVPLLRNNPHLRVNGDTVYYVSKLGIYSAEDLLRYLHNMPTFQGLSVRELKDGWSGALPTIANLENEQKIIVIRHRKDNSPRLIWPNLGGEIGKVNPKFVGIWQSARVPSANDLPGQLENVGLKPSSIDPRKIRRETKPAEKKPKRRAPRSRITNTHMKGLLKDFS